LPLIDAAYNGNEKIIQLLLRHGCDPSAKDNYGTTALFWAANKGHLIATKIMLETDRVGIDAHDDKGSTALHVAVLGEHEAVVSLLLSHGHDTTIQDKDGATAFDITIQKGNSNIAALLRP
jgi:uncharacterized protein